MLLKLGLLFSFLCSVLIVHGQDTKADSLLNKDSFIAELDSLMAQPEDSLALLNLLDSLLKKPKIHSQMLLRLGYNSNVVSAGRTLGFNQFGLSPGISYYHKSGLYLDASGYWSKEYTPDFYLTVLSGGFMKSVNNWWSFLTEYSRYVYSPTSDSTTYTPYTNNVGMSNFFDVGKLTFRLDYQFYFGEKSAHRVMPGIILNLDKRNLGRIKRINFFPSFYVLLGSEQIVNEYYKPYSTQPLQILFRIINNLPLYYFVSEKSTEFGVLNYSISAPISVQLKSWSFLISYTYNFPKALKGEVIDLTNSGYFSASITRRITFK